MPKTPEYSIMSEIGKAIITLSRIKFYYYQWFALYNDPLSDEIISDICQQAHDWAKVQAMKPHLSEFRVSDGSAFLGLSRH